MYTALKPGKSEFRLLRLLPASCAEHVVCEMRIFRLQGRHEPVYTALSYTWGADACEHEIVLNGDIVPVRKELTQLPLANAG